MWKLKTSEGTDPWLESLNDHIGRQHWEFDPEAGTLEERAEVERVRAEFKKNRFKNRQSADLLMRMQLKKQNPSIPQLEGIKVKENEEITEEAINTTIRRSINFFSGIQVDDGHWPAESAGPTYFLPPLIIAMYITGAINTIFSPEHQKEMKRYLYNTQNEDGGWGFHVEGPSTMFGSAINYIALRLLGEGPDDGEDNAIARCRQWILDHGGATAVPSWGKFWLTVLGVYEWEGCNPMPPESWLLPEIAPVNPGKMLCYSRLVFMPMSYLYGKKFVTPITPLIESLRRELHIEPYNEINWNKARSTCAKEDLYYPHPLVQDMVWGFLHHFVEPVLSSRLFSKLREKSLKKAMEHIHYEDINSRYLCIGCVEKIICMLACWVEDPNSDEYKKHLARIPDYYWLAEDGLKVQSFGCQMWDAAFAIQAIFASGLTQEYATTMKKAHKFLKDSQVKENPAGDFAKMHRHISKGAWTFSTRDHGWQVSDCTAESFKAAILFSRFSPEVVGERIEVERLHDAVNVILSLQSPSGGFPAWEPKRAYSCLELLNFTELFEDVLIEIDYVECTSSAIQGLMLFKKLYPGHRMKEIEKSIAKAIQFVEESQKPDGSWYGCWGICYTYGTWFGVEALVACGKNYHNSLALHKACHFLLSKQLPDGGWGESYLSSSNKVYTNIEGNKSNLVQTSWALLALLKAGYGDVDPTPIERGIRVLINTQMDDGDFPQQEITGIFMRTCSLQYSSYRNIFPIWALGEYRHLQARRSIRF